MIKINNVLISANIVAPTYNVEPLIKTRVNSIVGLYTRMSKHQKIWNVVYLLLLILEVASTQGLDKTGPVYRV